MRVWIAWLYGIDKSTKNTLCSQYVFCICLKNYFQGPWVLLGSMVGLGIVLTGFDAVIRAVKEDLPRKKLLFVQRRREKYIGQGN